ncbi:MAG: hypothetical protein MI741_19695 [Rhodospirillales bacterium]|nr:hypothetical protein [Rhodospirillales bacterium]
MKPLALLFFAVLLTLFPLLFRPFRAAFFKNVSDLQTTALTISGPVWLSCHIKYTGSPTIFQAPGINKTGEGCESIGWRFVSLLTLAVQRFPLP